MTKIFSTKNVLTCLALALTGLSAPGHAAQGLTAARFTPSVARLSFPPSDPNDGPGLGELKLFTEFPPHFPQRISDIAFDGEKLWVPIYMGRGRHAVFNPSTLGWELSDEGEHQRAIAEVSGRYMSPGGFCFADGKLWVADSYGESIGLIDPRDWKVLRHFKLRHREGPASQSYAAMTFDGTHLWVAWHWFRYDLPTSQTQLLLKLEPGTGKVVGEFPLPAGTANDGAHGLTWDGARLWHMKDSRLSSIDPATGRVNAQFSLPKVKRPNGLAWDGEALWIAEFEGKVWRLTL